MLEIINKIINLISDFFQNSKAKAIEIKKTAMDNAILANSIAAIKNNECINTALKKLKIKQDSIDKEESKKPVDEQFDNQMGKDK